MKYNLERIFEKARLIKLEPQEKSALRDKLVLGVRKKPVAEPYLSSLTILGFRRRFNFAVLLKPVLAGLLIFILVGGGAAVFAESALPGQALYPVKVGLTEPIREKLALTDQAKADWFLELADRRLKEAEKLVEKSDLSQEHRENLEEKINHFSEKLEEKLAKIESTGKQAEALEISSAFEATLKNHGKVLKIMKDLEEADEDQKGEIENLLEKIDRGFGEARNLRLDFQEKVASSSNDQFKQAVEGKLGAALSKLEEVKKFLENNRDHFEDEAFTKALDKLKDAEDKIDEAKEKILKGESADAFAKLQEAMRISQEAKLLAGSAGEFKLKLKVKDISGDHQEVEREKDLERNREDRRGQED